MKRTKLLAGIMAGVLSLGMLAGCGNSNEVNTNIATSDTATVTTTDSTAPATNSGEKGKIIFSITHMTNAFTVELSDAVKAQGEALGYKVEVVSADQDTNKQNNQIETAITQDVAAIIVEPVSVDGVVPAARAAKDAGIPIVIVNQQISDPTAADTYVGANAVETGKVLMDQVVKDLDGNGEIAEILGPMGSDGQIGRSQGFADALANSSITVAFESTADWDTDKALKLSENWITANANLVAIVAQNDNMGLGAQKAVEDAGLQDKIKTYGIDATPDGLQAVKDGRMAATVSQNTTLQGTTAVDLADKLIQGQSVEAENFVECILITQANVDEYLNA